MDKKVFYKWPEGYVGNAAPWYVILRRLFFVPFVVTGFLILYASLLFGWGEEEAERLKKDIL